MVARLIPGSARFVDLDKTFGPLLVAGRLARGGNPFLELLVGGSEDAR